MKLFVSILVVAVLGAPAAFAQDDDTPSLDDTPHITIVGTATEDVAPDLAIVRLGVTTEKPTATAAADETARKANDVVAAAKDLGVAQADIQTQTLTLTQTFDEVHDANGRYVSQKPRGFEAANAVQLRIRDLAKAGTIAQTLITKGANRLDGIDFTVEHSEPVQLRLTAAAVKNAHAQAAAAADAAGVKLGRVLQIGQPDVGNAPRPMRLAKAMAPASAAMPVEAGTNTTTTTIEVTWALDAR